MCVVRRVLGATADRRQKEEEEEKDREEEEGREDALPSATASAGEHEELPLIFNHREAALEESTKSLPPLRMRQKSGLPVEAPADRLSYNASQYLLASTDEGS